MLIPIGLDQTSVRRLPWVSFSIIAINVVAFLAVNASVHSAAKEISRRGQTVMTYWAQHPYLTFPEKMLPKGLSESQREKLTLLMEGMKSTTRKTPESEDQRREEQRELDRLVDRFQEALAYHPFRKWGLVPAHPRALAFLTSMFMHAGWLHLLGNMLFFYLSGPFIEDAFGRPLFAALYLSSGVVSSLVHIAGFPSSEAPLIGASGAIAGIMGAFLVRFVRRKIRFFYFFFVYGGTVDLPAWIVLPLWFVQQLFFAGLTGESGVAYRAHVGGFAFGFIAAVLIRYFRVEERFVAPKIERAISVTQHPALDEGLDLLARGEARAAREAFHKVLASEPRNVDARLALWESHCQEGTAAEGVEHLLPAIEEELKRGEVELALAHWREMVSAAHQGGPAPLQWRLGMMLEPEDPAAAIEVFRHLTNEPDAGLLGEKAQRRLAAMGVPTPPASRPPAAPAPVQPEAPLHLAAVQTRAFTAVAAPFAEADVPVPATDDGPGISTSETGAGWLEAPPAVESGGMSVEVCALEAVKPDGVMLRAAVGGCELLPFVDVEKVAVAGVTASERPYLVLDLLLRRSPGSARKVERLVSSQFDPRQMIGRPDLAPLAAFREMVRLIAEGAHAELTPPTFLAPSAAIPTFASLEEYERGMLAPLA
jgi:membrane associated rhomboid family serine protease